jgi:hypothetical protein
MERSVYFWDNRTIDEISTAIDPNTKKRLTIWLEYNKFQMDSDRREKE